ncbi:MAG: FliM/FliN family flagellar motor switch protein [Planctomycetales bacterium]|nr:FliM/FliN family flagellar motor switch protein [Planctomycetales bacterium]MBN8628427.1 FliM/FliN family flagellar motor switch protein [Planctomycetota bacterium]
MPELNSSIADQVVAACKAGSGDFAQAIGQILGAQPTIEIAEPTALDLAANSAALAGPGLAVMLAVGDAAAVAVLAESSKLLPDWYAAPDPTGASKLATFAQEASLLLLPDTLMAEEFRAQRVEDLAAALLRGTPAADAKCVVLKLSLADGRSGELRLAFPFQTAAEIYKAAEPVDSATASAPAAAATPVEAKPEEPREKPAGVLRGEQATRAVAAAQAKQQAAARSAHTLNDLPNYTRSLLRIQVPVMVTLASKKHQVSTILEIGPGTILQFKKSCDQLLELEVNGHAIGVGEAVKVGDKFGLRVTSLTLPGERFESLGKAS